MAIVSRTLDTLRRHFASLTWDPFVKLSRSTVLALLKRIEFGQLVIRENDGTVTICGAPSVRDGSPCTEMRILKEAFWLRVVLFADMVGDLILTVVAVSVRRLCDQRED